MTSALDRLPARARERLRPREQPEWTAPMLAVLTHQRFSDPGWIFERKLDGERCLAFRRGGRLRLLSRTRQLLNDTYPELVGALGSQVSDFIVDGEIVAFEGGRTSFERLQRRIQIRDPVAALSSGVRVFYYLFDVLHLDGYDTTALQQRDRKALLRNALSYGDPLRFLPHRNTEGEALYQDACRKSWEGLIAKRADAPYQHRRLRGMGCPARASTGSGRTWSPRSASPRSPATASCATLASSASAPTNAPARWSWNAASRPSHPPRPCPDAPGRPPPRSPPGWPVRPSPPPPGRPVRAPPPGARPAPARPRRPPGWSCSTPMTIVSLTREVVGATIRAWTMSLSSRTRPRPRSRWTRSGRGCWRCCRSPARPPCWPAGSACHARRSTTTCGSWSATGSSSWSRNAARGMSTSDCCRPRRPPT